jgi:potassium-dependent mechanosensitive channel
LKVPQSQVHFSGFGDSSLNFEIRVWINEPRNHTQIRSKVNFAIDSAFRKYNVENPFPQRDLHLRSGSIQLLNDGTGAGSLRVKVEKDEQ